MGSKDVDKSPIPDFSVLAGGMEISKRDYIWMEANYALVTDNLTDLSHTASLHAGSGADVSARVGRIAFDEREDGFTKTSRENCSTFFYMTNSKYQR